jgi:hypothetical protein
VRISADWTKRGCARMSRIARDAGARGLPRIGRDADARGSPRIARDADARGCLGSDGTRVRADSHGSDGTRICADRRGSDGTRVHADRRGSDGARMRADVRGSHATSDEARMHAGDPRIPNCNSTTRGCARIATCQRAPETAEIWTDIVVAISVLLFSLQNEKRSGCGRLWETRVLCGFSKGLWARSVRPQPRQRPQPVSIWASPRRRISSVPRRIEVKARSLTLQVFGDRLDASTDRASRLSCVTV